MAIHVLRKVPRAVWAVVGLAAVWALGVVIGTVTEPPAALDAGPLLRQIQRLGQLHTVRYSLHDTIRHEHRLHASGLWKLLPGADEFYGGVTRNTVTVEADGDVEAGVDLSNVTSSSVSRAASGSGERLRIRLPQVALYPPEVHLHVLNRHEGLFWQDENLVPEAESDAASRFRHAALRRGIVAEAERNAIHTLTGLERAAGHVNVEFYF